MILSPGEGTFPPGTSDGDSLSFSVNVPDDGILEGEEFIKFALSSDDVAVSPELLCANISDGNLDGSCIHVDTLGYALCS